MCFAELDGDVGVLVGLDDYFVLYAAACAFEVGLDDIFAGGDFFELDLAVSAGLSLGDGSGHVCGGLLGLVFGFFLVGVGFLVFAFGFAVLVMLVRRRDDADGGIGDGLVVLIDDRDRDGSHFFLGGGLVFG